MYSFQVDKFKRTILKEKNYYLFILTYKLYCHRLSNVDERYLNYLQPMFILDNVVMTLIKPFATILVANVFEFDEILFVLIDLRYLLS